MVANKNMEANRIRPRVCGGVESCACGAARNLRVGVLRDFRQTDGKRGAAERLAQRGVLRVEIADGIDDGRIGLLGLRRDFLHGLRRNLLSLFGRYLRGAPFQQPGQRAAAGER